MNNEILKIGVVVRLRSGGPLLTVIEPNAERSWGENAHEYATCICSWFDGEAQLHTEMFPVESLIVSDDIS